MSEIWIRDEAEGLVAAIKAARDELTYLPFASIHSVTPEAGDIDAALAGSYRLRKDRFRLDLPVDWWDEPYRADGERGFFQNSFVFADPLLASARFSEVLDRLATIFCDWLEANPREGALHPHRYAWHDHAAAGRLVYLAFVLREGIVRELLDVDVATTLAAGVLDHATYVMADENYAAHSNHGLFSDAALALAARALAPASPTGVWSETAERRFAVVLERTIAPNDALHLEHSTYYHWIIHRALARFAEAGIFERLDLLGLTRRMEAAGAWLAAPDGTLPQIGDTPSGQRLPREAQAYLDGCNGMRAFREAGYVAVRAGGSALVVTAAHHPTAHKHADDGSFCLYEAGRPIVTDSGDPGYDYTSSERRYGVSAAAHSTICVDGFDWVNNRPPYGSGVLDAVERDGLYAILTHNPGALPDGGARRILLYRPGRYLVVVDDVDDGPRRTLTQRLPLAAPFDAREVVPGTVDIAEGIATVARVIPFSLPAATPPTVEIVRGRRAPELAGFVFPSPGLAEPRCDVAFSAPTGSPRALVIDVGVGITGSPRLAWNRGLAATAIEVRNVEPAPIKLTLRARALDLLV